ncbi:putative L1 [Equus asinus papillomavirus 1]|uniref:Major capsid protein L1 n=1 Tax=Equus asinus papillomavirus 1 TaxID=1163703 RepID=W5ZSS5_9PAPI|nr:putative L1 [Equus asinus papillomavirus 1]AHI45086.1 putative L1 [Equus asinus papillomavirus 1]
MAVWLPAQNKFYLPPTPVIKVVSTDDYVERTPLFYSASSERLLTVGHPLYSVSKNPAEQSIPKVSPNQYRVFRCKLPNPNNFAFHDLTIFNAEQERLVWALRAIEVGRGQPLGIGASGSPYFNKHADVENPGRAAVNPEDEKDNRRNLAFEPKQVQILIVGNSPAMGEYWTAAAACEEVHAEQGDCPGLELKSEYIEDGHMTEIGLGALDFKTLQVNRSDAPLDINTEICRYPDFLKMANDPTGGMAYFFAKKEQLYGRHLISRAGIVGDKVPVPDYWGAGRAGGDFTTAGPPNYTVLPSGSLVNTEGQIFNRPFWLTRAQGLNNGIVWEEDLFVTLADNTRGTTLSINTLANGGAEEFQQYQNNKVKEYSRHVEEYQLDFVFQLCKVRLTPENLAIIHSTNPRVLDKWHLAAMPANNTLDDIYRNLKSQATRCPLPAAEVQSDDPYKDLKFWDIDLTGSFTEELDQTALGRKFLYQTALYRRTLTTRKRPRPTITAPSSSRKPAKKRRSK